MRPQDVKHDRSARAKFPYVNAMDGLIVVVVCSLVFMGYLRFSEPFRMARSEGDTAKEPLRVELCLPSGSQWLVGESIEGFEDTDPHSGMPDMRLSRAYRASDSSTRLQMELMVRRDSEGIVHFRDRPLILGMKLYFDTSELVVEGSLCGVGLEDEAR